jgi:pyruvate,water dikinase
LLNPASDNTSWLAGRAPVILGGNVAVDEGAPVSHIVWFDEPAATQPALTGGKGANLAALTSSGFEVPPGFVVSTSAYRNFVDLLRPSPDEQFERLDEGRPDQLADASARIRALIEGSPLPDSLRAELTASYAKLGPDAGVAVRSSGTAEDLEDASFAGMHDTYLDVRGEDALVDAVRRCWASMWTERAVAYRRDRGFDHRQASIAVVVQTMVSAEVSGVMFTGNPVNTATDEFMINASYGLGEAVVSGIVTPDQFVLAAGDLRVKDAVLGRKAVQVVRNPDTGRGTVTREVPAADRGRYSLTEDQLAALGQLGRRVMAHYDGLPQDIEWAIANDDDNNSARYIVYLLQSRPVTGVEFSWDADVDAWQPLDPAPDDTIWTRAWADEAWTGPQTPLFYSMRLPSLSGPESNANRLRGFEPESRMRYMTYYKAKAYFNCTLHRQTLIKSSLPFMRVGQQANWLPPAWREEALTHPLSVTDYLKLVARLNLLCGNMDLVRWRHVMQGWIDNPEPHPDNVSNLDRLSEAELRRRLAKTMRWEQEFCRDTWFAWVQYPRDIWSFLELMITRWYSGDPAIMGELFAGTTRVSKSQLEGRALCELAGTIGGSAGLRRCFDQNQGLEFFSACEQTEEGRRWLADYRAFVAEWGFRGHEDRDVYFPRRCEDPAIDYRSLRALLSGDDSLDIEAREAEVNARREVALDTVVTDLRRGPLGGLKAEVFKVAHAYFHDWIVLRDDERWSTDRITMTQRLILREYGRRLLDRGLIERPDDHFFLTLTEMYELSDGSPSRRLIKAKIAARRRNFERLYRREVEPPAWLRHGKGVDLDDPVPEDGDGVFTGLPTSNGDVTGRARIVRRVQDIGRLDRGDILVCNSTDPGWTPVFAVVAGVVTETGGILAHASCLSREYGLPAVQLANAMRRIPDGARIRVDGTGGRIVVLADPVTSTEVTE